jgi:hypothetical protein
MSYEEVDPIIQAWAERHSLQLSTFWIDREVRSAYVSSNAGDCFRFWLDCPQGGRIGLHAAGVDGQWIKDPAKDWLVPILELEAALEDAFATVTGWMVPSKRYLPSGGNQ